MNKNETGKKTIPEGFFEIPSNPGQRLSRLLFSEVSVGRCSERFLKIYSKVCVVEFFLKNVESL